MTSNVKRKGKITLPARATVFYTLTGALERGTNLIFTPIFTRMLTPEEYGIYPLYVSWMGILTVVCTLELTGNVIYKGLSKYRGREGDFLSASLGLISLSSLTVLLLFLPLGDGVLSFIGLNRGILLLLILQIYINGVTNLYFARCRYFYRYKSASLINLLAAILSPTLSFLIIRLTAFDGEARIIGPLVVSGVIAVPLAVSFIRRSKRLFDGGIWRYLLRLVLPLLPHFLASTVIAQSGKIAVGRFFGDGELAKYSLVFSLGFLFSVITNGINSGLSPWINRKLSHGAGHTVDLTVEKLFSVFAALSLMGVCFIPEGLSFLAPPEYLGALPAVYPIAISVLLSFLGSTLYTVIVYYERTYLVTLGSVGVAVLTVILHLTLTARYGFMAAALVQVIASASLVLANAIILGGVLKNHSFKLKNYLGTLTGAVLFAATLSYLRDMLIPRILVFIALLLILIPRAVSLYRLIKEKD